MLDMIAETEETEQTSLPFLRLSPREIDNVDMAMKEIDRLMADLTPPEKQAVIRRLPDLVPKEDLSDQLKSKEGVFFVLTWTILTICFLICNVPPKK